MRWAVLAALLLAVLLSLPTTLAVRTASVDGEGQVAVLSTSTALLSLTPGSGEGNAANTAHYRDAGTEDTLVLDFRRGLGSSASYAFPPNTLAYRDKFRFRGLFTVTNRSDELLCISVHVPGGGVADLAGIYLRTVGDPGSGTATAGSGGSKNGCATWLGTGASFEVDFWWEIDSTGSLTDSFSVRVEGTR